jgi:signal transduction histidine kinase
MLSPVQAEDGTLVISAIRDITRRIEAEKALRQREAELAEMQRRLIDSVEAERLHLSQELHDGPIQDLYALMYQLKDLEKTLQESPSPEVDSKDIQEGFSGSLEVMPDIIQRLRSLCGELRPPALTPFGLEKAIEAHLELIREKYPGLLVKSELMPDGQAIPERVRLALYRIYQHAISNVIRHAEAKTLTIRFQIDPLHCSLEVEDDGCGFNLPSRWVDLARSGHLGLVGTVERTEAIGGELKIDSTPGTGTWVQVIVPLGQAQMV